MNKIALQVKQMRALTATIKTRISNVQQRQREMRSQETAITQTLDKIERAISHHTLVDIKSMIGQRIRGITREMVSSDGWVYLSIV